uniref:Uncharacterized protein n=2 Tax=Macaca TaxID=9539 RepID=F7FS80_MACMU
MCLSIRSEEVSGWLCGAATSLESSPGSTGAGKAAGNTRSSPREKATGPKAPVPEGTLKLLKPTWFRAERRRIQLTSLLGMSKEDLVASSRACVYSSLSL